MKIAPASVFFSSVLVFLDFQLNFGFLSDLVLLYSVANSIDTLFQFKLLYYVNEEKGGMEHSGKK